MIESDKQTGGGPYISCVASTHTTIFSGHTPRKAVL
jgi:hypothetical protein